LDEIDKILSKDPRQRSNLEKSIIMAITWIGLGADDDVIYDKFLKYAFALECLLIKRDQMGDKGDPIAKRAAFLLGKTVIDCNEIVSDLKRLYGIRSTLVHQGFEPGDEKIIEEYAKKMYYYSMSTLIKLSKKLDEYEDIDDLVNQMDEQMYCQCFRQLNFDLPI